MTFFRLRPFFVLLCCIMCAGTAEAGQDGFFLSYGQSENVYRIISDVKGAKKNLPRINQILNENYGSYETAFATLGTQHAFPIRGRDWLKAWNLRFSVEAAAVGLVQNPVVPELLASALAVGIIRSGIVTILAEGFTFEAALALGWGIERRLSAVSTDLIEKVPFQKENVILGGVDLFAQKRWKGESTDWSLSAMLEETYYKGMNGQVSVALDRDLRSFTHQWQTRLDYLHSRYNIHGILGPHPLPSPLLPRVWNRAANTYAWRELGAMVGGGAGATWKTGKSTRIALIGGLYAGYLGGEFRMRWGEGNSASLSSYEIENSAAYKTLGRRVYAFSAFFAY